MWQMELSHFENRIRKSHHIKERLEKAQQKVEAGHELNVEEHEELKKTAKLYDRKVCVCLWVGTYFVVDILEINLEI